MQASCEIPYIDNNYTGQQKDELRDKHIEIVAKVLESKLFRRVGEELTLSKDITSNTRRKQLDFVNKYEDEGLKWVSGDNGFDILSLKVDSDGNYFEFNPAFLTEDETEMKNKSEFSELLNNENTQDWFDSKIVEVKKVLQNYIDLLQDKTVDFPLRDLGLKLSELKSLRNILSNKENIEIISGLNSYVEKAVQWADTLNDELFSDETNRLLGIINDKTTELDKYNEAIKELAKIANRSKHFLYLFDNLKDFRQDLIDKGFITEDKYTLKFYNQKDVFAKELGNLRIPDTTNLESVNIDWLYQVLQSPELTIEDFKKETIATFLSLNESPDGEPFNDYFKIKKFEQMLDDIIEENIKMTFNAQMQKTLAKVDSIKTKIKNLHYQTATKFLFPIYNAKQIQARGEDSPDLINEEQFKTLLSLANTGDNDFTALIESISNTNDAVTASVYAKFVDLQADRQFINVKESSDLAEIHDDVFKVNKTDEYKKKVFGDMQTYTDELVKDKNDNPVLAEEDDRYIEIPTLLGNIKYKTRKVNAFHSTKKDSKGQYKYSKNEGFVFSKLKLLKNSFYEYIPLKDENDKYVKDENGKQIYKSHGLLKDLSDVFDKSNFQDMFDSIPDSFAYKNVIVDAFKDKKGLIHKNIDDKLDSLNNDEQIQYIRTIIKKAIIDDFNDEHFEFMDEIESRFIIDSNNLQNNLNEETIFKFGNSSKPGSTIKLVDNSLPANVLGYKHNNENYIFYTDENGKIKFGKYLEVKKDIYTYFFKTNEFKQIVSGYNVGKYEGDQSKYFEYIKDKYFKYNSQLPPEAKLQGNIVPQFGKTGLEWAETKENTKDLWKGILEWFKDMYKNFRKYWNENEENQTPETIVDFQQQYLNGLDVKKIGVKGLTTYQDQSKLNPMLNETLMSFIMTVNQQTILKEIEPQMEVIKTIAYGDIKLGIDQRNTKIKDFSGKYVINNSRGNSDDRYKKKIAKNLNSNLIEFIDQQLYAIDDIPFAGIGRNAVEKVLTKATGYMSLALNAGSMISNLFNGKIATYLESVQGTFFTEKEYYEAEKEYWKPKNSAKYISDFLETNIGKKSFVSQLLVWTDGIQGEFIDNFDESLKKKKWNDLVVTALTFTQNAPEHEIQTVNMIAMLKKDGLWQKYEKIFEENNGKLVFTEKELIELKKFQSKLHSVNRNLNGIYANIDKTRLQRRWFGRLIMTFRKHIYPFFKARFGEERLDVGSETLMRGYVRSYYSELINDILSEKATTLKATKIIKQWGMDSLRLSARLVNRATFGKVNFDEQLYKEFQGDKRKLQEAKRFVAEMSTYTIITLLAVLVAALEDDDDDNVALQALQLILRKQSLDMGMFMPTMVANPITFTSAPFNTYDGLMKIVSSPMTAMRTIDNSVSLLGQLTGVKFEDGGLDFAFNDEYTKGGNGYEKGDLKINRKLQKTLLAPYWQVLKFLNPEDQLNYLNVINKNSK